MQLCPGTAFHETNSNNDAASRDLALVAAAKSGSSAAFAEIQGRHSLRLYKRIHSITRNHEDAEDAARRRRFFVRISRSIPLKADLNSLHGLRGSLSIPR